jgi:peptide chain release factor 1
MGLEADLLHSVFGHKIVQISGPNAIKAFENETGKHIVQRIPPTETKGRKQTSVISVAVLSLPPEKNEKPLNMSDVEITCAMGQGPGGQHRQKTASRVTARHKPSGLSVVIDGRDQSRNRKDAIRILTARVNEQEIEKKEAEYGAVRKAHLGNGSRGEKRRTYNFLESRISDHILGTKTSNIKEVMKGNFGLLFKKK